jgi:uncharacterized membrane protein YagU involved in acid resistance
MRPDPWRAILGGFAGTAVMTVLLYMLAPLVMSEPPDIAMMVDQASYWLPAMFLHFVNGSITLPLIYAYLASRVLPGQPWLRGALWGLILWAVAELVVMPLMGVGPFSEAPAGVIAVTALVLLVGHVVYGTLLGWLAGGSSPERSDDVSEAPRLAA